MGWFDNPSGAFAGSMGPLASFLANIPHHVVNGMDSAGRDLLGGYARAMNPAIMNEPFGAWQRLGALGMGAPAGALGEKLAAPSLAGVLNGGSYASDLARLINQSGQVFSQMAPQQSQGMTHDPYTGAIVDQQGNRWY